MKDSFHAIGFEFEGAIKSLVAGRVQENPKHLRIVPRGPVGEKEKNKEDQDTSEE